MKNCLKMFRVAAVAAVFIPHLTQAATYNWNVTSGNWNDASSWDPAGIPTSADTAVFGNNGVAADNVTINNVVNVSTNVAELNYTNNVTGEWHNTQIAAGAVLTVSGATQIGATGSGIATSVTISGPGALVANGSFTVNDSAGGSANSTMILDMSGLGSFTNDAPSTTLAVGTGTQVPATLSLASNSFINVSVLNVETSGSKNGRAGELNLGAITNTIQANNINLSTGKGQTTKIQFLNDTGSVSIAGTGGGAARADMLLGNGTSGSAVCHGQLLLAGHLANVLAGTIILGGSGGSDSGTGDDGIVTFDHGVFDVTSILMGNTKTSSSGKSTSGTFTVGGDAGNTGTLIVNSPSGPGGGALVLGNTTTVNEAGAGTLNINQNGIAQVYCAITKANAAQNTATINITSGTLVMFTNTIGTVTEPIDNFNVTDSTLTVPANLTAVANVITLVPGGTANTINISSVPLFFAYPAQFPIIAYQVTGGDNNTFVAGTIPGGFQGYISNNVTTLTIDLVITNGPALIALKTINWNGTINGDWDTTTKNWITNGVQTNYFQGDYVTFDDTLAGTANVVLTTAMSPSSLTVNNSSANYVFSGTGKISGATGLSKQGSGTLVLDNSGNNDFVGAVTISGGTLQIGNSDSNGNLPAGDIQDDGALAFSRTDDVVFGNIINGTGSLNQIGSGKLTLTGVNTFSGNTIVANGTLALTSAGTISSSGLISVHDGTLDVSAITDPSVTWSSLALSTNGKWTLSGKTASVAAFSATNSTISLAPDVNVGAAITASTLVTGGTTNYVNIQTVLNLPDSPALPIVIPLISYTSATFAGGFNFGVANLANAYITNNAANSTIDLVLTAVPFVVSWNGGSATDNLWSDAANWSGTPIAPTYSLVFDGNARLNTTNDTAALTAYTNITFNSGAGAFTLNGNPINGAGITNNSANPQTINLGLAFGRSIGLNGGTGGLFIGEGLTNTLGAPGFVTVTLAGKGVLTNILASANSPGGTNVLAVNDSAANWTLMDNASSATMTVPWALNVIDGTFNFGTASSAPSLTSISAQGAPQDNVVGATSFSTGTLNLSNGTFTTSARLNTGTAGDATGIINIYGGTLTAGNQFQGANGAATATSIVNVSGGTMNAGTVAAPNGAFFVASRGIGTLNMISGALNCGTLDVSRNAAGNTAGSVGVVNLNGGQLAVNSVSTVSANAQAGGSPTATFNFNGGTLKARTSSTTFFRAGTAAPAPALTAYVKSGGAIIDTTNFNVTVVEPLLHDPDLGVTADGGLKKLGSGTLTLSGGNTYTGPTLVGEGTLFVSGSLDVTAVTVSNTAVLAGTGSVGGAALVQAGGTVSPGGANTIGTLSVAGAVTLQGTTYMEVDRNAGSDLLGGGSLSYGGTLQLVNLGDPLQVGDQFQLFSAPSLSGSFAVSGPAGVQWDTSTLATDGIIKVSAVVDATPTNIVTSVTGNQLTLSWPANHIGWRLQVQTNSLSTGLGTNWVDVPGSTTVNTYNASISTANGSVFFRLVYP